jgi:excisionase family DNA binding protein
MAVIQLAEGYMTIAEAARRKGVSRSAIYQAIREGRLRATRISGGTTIIADSDINAFVPRKRTRNMTPKDDRPIWEKIAALGREIPAEEWEKVPKDASINLKHYLYGHPKVEE